MALLIPHTVRADEEGDKQINGVRIHYHVVGKGIPVVVLHGGPGLDHTYFLPQMAALADHYRLIFYDQRACGKSSGAEDTASITMHNFVEDLEGIRKAFNLGRMNLMAHSWGGLLGMEYAIAYPGHLRSLMLINPTSASSVLRDSSFAKLARLTTREDSLAEAALKATEGYKQRTPEAMAEIFRLLFRKTFYNRELADSLTLIFDSSYAAKNKALFTGLAKDLTKYDITPQLDTITCPTLLISGDHDINVPEALEQIHRRIRGSEFITLEQCGHFPFIELPGKFADVINRFMKKVR